VFARGSFNGATTLGIMTFSIRINKTGHQHNSVVILSAVMLNVTYKLFMLSVVMLSAMAPFLILARQTDS